MARAGAGRENIRSHGCGCSRGILSVMNAVTPRITRDDLLARWAQADQADPAVIEAAKQRARTVIDSLRDDNPRTTHHAA